MPAGAAVERLQCALFKVRLRAIGRRRTDAAQGRGKDRSARLLKQRQGLWSEVLSSVSLFVGFILSYLILTI